MCLPTTCSAAVFKCCEDRALWYVSCLVRMVRDDTGFPRGRSEAHCLDFFTLRCFAPVRACVEQQVTTAVASPSRCLDPRIFFIRFRTSCSLFEGLGKRLNTCSPTKETSDRQTVPWPPILGKLKQKLRCVALDLVLCHERRAVFLVTLCARAGGAAAMYVRRFRWLFLRLRVTHGGVVASSKLVLLLVRANKEAFLETNPLVVVFLFCCCWERRRRVSTAGCEQRPDSLAILPQTGGCGIQPESPL